VHRARKPGDRTIPRSDIAHTGIGDAAPRRAAQVAVDEPPVLGSRVPGERLFEAFLAELDGLGAFDQKMACDQEKRRLPDSRSGSRQATLSSSLPVDWQIR